jgi:hypothetical protein
LSVADNAGDAVLLHVSASNERQESRNETGLKKKEKKSKSYISAMPLDQMHLIFIVYGNRLVKITLLFKGWQIVMSLINTTQYYTT